MSIFKNRETGDIVTAFGPVHDNYAARLDYELVSEDCDGERDIAPQPDVLDEPSQDPEDPEGAELSDSQDPTPAAKASAKTRSTK